jgi:hypothetical protein
MPLMTISLIQMERKKSAPERRQFGRAVSGDLDLVVGPGLKFHRLVPSKIGWPEASVRAIGSPVYSSQQAAKPSHSHSGAAPPQTRKH